MMTRESDGMRLRIFVGELDKHDGKPLYEWIVLHARERGLAGATVLRGVMGFGAQSRIHTAKILRLSEDLPVVIELVDERTKIETFLAELDDLLGASLATLEPVEIVRSGKKP